MLKKFLPVSLFMFGILFFQDIARCDEHEYAKEGLSPSERVSLFYVYVTSKWPADEIWSQMCETMTIIADGNDAAGQAAIDKLVADYSGNQYLPMALHEIGKFCRLIGKLQKGLELQQYIIDKWPGDECAMWSLREAAVINIELGNMEAAKTTTDTVFTRFAQNEWIAGVGHEISNCYMKFGKYKEARDVCQYVIEHWPDNYWTGLARAKIERIDLILSGRTLTETEINAQRDLAMVYIHNDKMDDAQTIIDQLIADCSSDPHGADAIFDIGRSCQEAGKYEKALELHQYVVNTWPRHNMAMWSQSCIAICNIGLGNIEAADAAMQKLLANYPGHDQIATAVYDAAATYFVHGHYRQAQELCQRIVDSWPDDKEASAAQWRIAQCYEKLKDANLPETSLQIEEAYKKVIEMSPESTLVSYAATSLGWLTFKQARWNDAAHYFQMALDNNREDAPRPIDILYPLARAYEQIGQPDKAIELYTELLNTPSLGPDSIAKIKTRLEELTGASK